MSLAYLPFMSHKLASAQFYAQVMSSPRYSDPLRLLRSGFKVYSQNDEDGIIQEIFRRIGTTNLRFIELGITPLESNTMFLLFSGWRGLWLDRQHHNLEPLAHHLRDSSLRFVRSVVTSDNINTLLRPDDDTRDIDLLSIDIDRNDYWIWEVIEVVCPRVVVIEYNATFPPPVSVAAEYVATGEWNRSNYYGASLEALTRLGRKKGYDLVGCNFQGVNAFFVRSDLTADLFCKPFTAENHYEPPRFFVEFYAGHPPGYGPFVSIT